MDLYLGGGSWVFDNGAFTEDMIGGTVAIAGSPEAELNDTFTIQGITSPTEIDMAPAPSGGPIAVAATSITLVYDPPSQSTAGPEIVGIALIPLPKDGADKLPASRRAT